MAMTVTIGCPSIECGTGFLMVAHDGKHYVLSGLGREPGNDRF